jgi:hypothetical protein
MEALWEELGFTVHLLGDFNPFAERQGVVHCIKKYVTRGDSAGVGLTARRVSPSASKPSLRAVRARREGEP